jgi:hypothetical protein
LRVICAIQLALIGSLLFVGLRLGAVADGQQARLASERIRSAATNRRANATGAASTSQRCLNVEARRRCNDGGGSRVRLTRYASSHKLVLGALYRNAYRRLR